MKERNIMLTGRNLLNWCYATLKNENDTKTREKFFFNNFFIFFVVVFNNDQQILIFICACCLQIGSGGTYWFILYLHLFLRAIYI